MFEQSGKLLVPYMQCTYRKAVVAGAPEGVERGLVRSGSAAGGGDQGEGAVPAIGWYLSLAAS
jgi:hypothetical protein